MSRELPAQPNLEYLKKEAKEFLRELQQRDGDARLADAQHLLARAYGFASWAKLKSYVDAASVDLLSGTWTLDVSKSSPHPDNPVRSATVQFEVTGNLVTIRDVVVSASGEVNRTTNALHTDDVERTSAHGYAVRARWRNPRVLEWEAKQHGQPIGQGLYEVTADGARMIATSAGRTFVFDRE